jgi:hypothetical protein
MKLEMIDEDERFRASLPFEHCYDEVKDVIKEACQFQLDADRLIENEYKARIAELEALIPTREEATAIICHFYSTYQGCNAKCPLKGKCFIYDGDTNEKFKMAHLNKLQKIAGK